MIRALAPPTVFRALEIGQNAGITPTREPGLTPLLVIQRMPARVDHRIDRRGASQHLAARHEYFAVVAMRLRLGGELPIEAGMGAQPSHPEGHVDVGIPVAAAGLQEKDRGIAILAQAVREDAARRSGSDDDVIIRFHIAAIARAVFPSLRAPSSAHRRDAAGSRRDRCHRGIAHSRRFCQGRIAARRKRECRSGGKRYVSPCRY